MHINRMFLTEWIQCIPRRTLYDSSYIAWLVVVACWQSVDEDSNPWVSKNGRPVLSYYIGYTQVIYLGYIYIYIYIYIYTNIHLFLRRAESFHDLVCMKGILVCVNDMYIHTYVYISIGQCLKVTQTILYIIYNYIYIYKQIQAFPFLREAVFFHDLVCMNYMYIYIHISIAQCLQVTQKIIYIIYNYIYVYIYINIDTCFCGKQ